MKIYLTFVIVLISLLLSLVLYVNASFLNMEVNPFYDDSCKKIWGHRGYFKNQEMNSLGSFKEAFDFGAPGVELDIFYGIEKKQFLVLREYSGEKKEADTLLLEDVFLEMGDRGYFWLDFKNMVDMSRDETTAASLRMRELLDRYGLLEKVIVESKNAWNLAIFSALNIHTSYWINVNLRDNALMAWLKVFRHKARFVYGKFSAVSINYLNFTPYVQTAFSGIPVHIFTLNRQSDVHEFMQRKNVKIILSDQKYYSMSVCEE